MTTHWEELPISEKNQYGKYNYQNTEVIITSVSPPKPPSEHGSFQEITILRKDGMVHVPCSVFLSKKAGDVAFDPQTDVNKSHQVRMKIEPASDQYAFRPTPESEGRKLTIMKGHADPNKSGGYGGKGGGRGWQPPDPKTEYKKSLTMLTSYAKDLVVADKLPLDKMMSHVQTMDEYIQQAVETKFPSKDGNALPPKPNDGIPV